MIKTFNFLKTFFFIVKKFFRLQPSMSMSIAQLNFVSLINSPFHKRSIRPAFAYKTKRLLFVVFSVCVEKRRHYMRRELRLKNLITLCTVLFPIGWCWHEVTRICSDSTDFVHFVCRLWEKRRSYSPYSHFSSKKKKAAVLNGKLCLPLLLLCCPLLWDKNEVYSWHSEYMWDKEKNTRIQWFWLREWNGKRRFLSISFLIRIM